VKLKFLKTPKVHNFNKKLHLKIYLMTTTPANISNEIIQQWVNNNLSDDEVKLWLKQFNIDEATAATYFAEFNKLKLKKRSSLGIGFMITGAFVGFISCALSIATPHPIFLYGLTSLAIIIVFIGLYLIFE